MCAPLHFRKPGQSTHEGVREMNIGPLASMFMAMVSQTAIVALLALSPAHAGVFDKLFAPKAKLWERWTPHDPMASDEIDHSPWDKFLRAYVLEHEDGINRVAYGRVTDESKAELSNYISALASTAIDHYNRAEQLAYWINLYNVLTVKLVLDHYPVESIRDIMISPGPFNFGPWGKKLISLRGEELSLNDIEHRILRPIWRDPRIHYAVNCASLGCPNLQHTAFTARNSDTLLDTGARQYVNHPRGVRIEQGKLIASSIYVWFKKDFVNADGSVPEHLRRYATPDLAARLAGAGPIRDSEYDWALNDSREHKAGWDGLERVANASFVEGYVHEVAGDRFTRIVGRPEFSPELLDS